MLIVVTGLNNAGKTTIIEHLVKYGYKPVIEYTTRPMREGEINHKNYHFIGDKKFDEMALMNEFAETLYVETIYGLWKYGARKADLKADVNDDILLTCGPTQVEQLLDNGIKAVTVVLDIDKKTALERAKARGSKGDNLDEFNRRFDKDSIVIDRLRDKVTMVLDGRKPTEVNARAIDYRHSLERYIKMRPDYNDMRRNAYLRKES